MVIVMPAFAEGYESQQKTVSTVIGGFKSLLSEEMCERVDAGGSMEKKRGADEKAPHEQLAGGDSQRGDGAFQNSAEDKKRESQGERNEGIKTVQKDELRILREIFDP